MFLQVSVCPQGRGHAWLLGGMRGCWGWHVWLLGGVHGCWGDMCGCQGVCMVKGGMCGKGGVHSQGGHVWEREGAWWRGCAWQRGVCVAKGDVWWGGVWDTMRYRDTINEQAVHILLECILVIRSGSIHNVFYLKREMNVCLGYPSPIF